MPPPAPAEPLRFDVAGASVALGAMRELHTLHTDDATGQEPKDVCESTQQAGLDACANEG